MERNLLLQRYSLKKLRMTPMVLSWALIAFLALFSSRLSAQNTIRVKGKVTDAKGEALPGVTVRASSGSAVATAVDGTYSITADPQGTLTFSFLGYNQGIVKVDGQATHNVTLTDNNKQLNDVVVIGYGTQKRKDVTGSITTIKLEDSPKAVVPLVNPVEALQGTPGINVGPSTAAGATPNIVVRGQNSVTASLSPLIVLDGVIFNGDLNEINMNDVASFDVLKDASAASIYGSRSQNGVVIITTKKGRTDKPQINLNAYYGNQSWTRVPKMRTGDDYIQWRKDLAISKGQDASDLSKLLSPLELQAYNAGYQTDWLKDITQDAPIQNYDLSVSGRTDKLNYYFSAGYLDQKGVLYNDKYKKPSFTVKLENTINSWLSYGANGYYSSRDYSGIPADLYMATYMSPYSYKYMANSNQLQRYPTGSTSLYNPYWGNPNTSLLGTVDDNLEKYNSVRGTGFINIKFPFLKGLNYRVNITGERQNTNTANFHHETAEVNTLIATDLTNPAQYLGKAYGSRSKISTAYYSIDNLLTYNHDFGDHHIDLLAGYTRDHTEEQGLSVRGSDYSAYGTTALGYNGLTNAASQTIIASSLPVPFGNGAWSGTTLEAANVGYLARVAYNYKSKYYLFGNFRRDGYSAFAPGHKFGSFPGVSAAWAITEESFMKNISWINNLKLRAGYGRTGNQGVSPYATQDLVSTNYLSPYYTVFGSTSTQYSFPSQLGNKDLTWEKTDALNVGLDFILFKGRLSGSIDVYKSATKDQLIQRLLPDVTGYNSVNSNLGQVDNKGIEVSLTSVNIKPSSPGGFKWETGYSFWMNRNKLVHLYYVNDPVTGKEKDDTGMSLFIGQSLGAIYDYKVDGIVQASDVDYIKQYGAVAGDLKIVDINNDGKITPTDRSVIGNSKENFNLNLSNTLTYKSFQLYFTINSVVGGHHWFESTNIRGLDPGAVTLGNWLEKPYWTPTNNENKYPRPNYNNPYGYGFYQDRTFARLQFMSFSYAFPKTITDKLKISNLKVYVSGTNLVTLTKWTGLDPANGAQAGGNGGSSNTSVNQSYPLIRTFTFGLNAGF